MNFLALLPIFTTLIERLFPDKEKAAEAALEMRRILSEADAKRAEAEAIQMQAKSEVIKAELQTDSWMAKNWRALLMMTGVVMLINNWVFTPLLSAIGLPIVSVPIPVELWTLLSIGLGGYIGRETIKNYSDAKYGAINDKAFFEYIKTKKGPMTQADVDVYNEALKARNGG
jgi:hypothetical protein